MQKTTAIGKATQFQRSLLRVKSLLRKGSRTRAEMELFDETDEFAGAVTVGDPVGSAGRLLRCGCEDPGPGGRQQRLVGEQLQQGGAPTHPEEHSGLARQRLQPADVRPAIPKDSVALTHTALRPW